MLLVPPAVASAQACSCTCPGDGLPFFRTLTSPQTLAPNARIFARLSGFDASTVRLETASGSRIPLTLTAAGDASGTALWIAPNERLAPGAYTLAVDAAGGGPTYARDVMVGSDDDTTPPRIENVRLDDLGGIATCSSTAGIGVVWDVIGTPDAEVVDGEYVVEVALQRDGVGVGTVFPREIGPTGTSWFGSSADPACLGVAQASGVTEGMAFTATVRVWDAAGNATIATVLPFRAARSTPLGATPCMHGGCSASPPMRGAPSWAAWIAAPLLLRRRRRRVTGGGS